MKLFNQNVHTCSKLSSNKITVEYFAFNLLLYKSTDVVEKLLFSTFRSFHRNDIKVQSPCWVNKLYVFVLLAK